MPIKFIWTEKLFFRMITLVTTFVLVLVLVLHNKWIHAPTHPPHFTRYLPALNAILNGTCSILLLLSLYFILHKQVRIHKRLNITTFLLSSIFLISYVLYHFFQKETRFPVGNPYRPLYHLVLASHILLAGLVLPLILLSFYYAFKEEFIMHRKIVRWTYPIWLYVTLTGVVVYYMISPYYTF